MSSQFPHWHLFRPSLIALALSAPLALPITAQAASAQTVVQRYQIPAGTLEQALNALGRQAGIVLMFPSELVRGQQSAGLQGEFTVDAALMRLLAGTSLTATRQDGGGYSISQTQEGTTTLPPLTISASSPASTQTTLGYNYEELQTQQPQSIKDVFRDQSAVAVGGSIPVNQKVYVRGVEESAMLVTVDGARQNNKVFHHNATNLIDPALLKAASASAGVSAADDGPGALGGSLKYETVDVADVLTPGQSLGGFLNGRYASNGDQLTTAGSLYGKTGGLEALAFINHSNGDSYENGEGDTVRFTAPDLLSRLIKVAYETEQQDRFELSHERVNDNSLRPYRANFVGLTAGRPVPESRVYDLTRENTTFNYSRETGSGLWNPSITLAKSETELETREHPLAAPSTTLVYTGLTESQSATVKNRFHSRFGEITAGLDYYDDRAAFMSAGSPTLEEKADNTGAFVQLRQTLADGTLDLSYGLRHDRESFTGTDGSDHSDSGSSGNVFADYRVNNTLSVNAGYAKVWGGIDLAENFILNSAWDYRDLNAVDASNYTVGLRLLLGDIMVEANRYRTKIENGRVPSYSGGSALVADFDIDGYDLALSYNTALTELSLKYADIESEKDGEPASSYDGNYFTAPLGKLITLNGKLKLLADQLMLGMSAEVALGNDDTRDSGAKQKGYTVVNLYADYAVLSCLSLRVEVDNLTDRAYTDRASYGQEFATVKPLLEPGRSVAVSARYTF